MGMTYYKRPNYKNNSEEVFYSMNSENRVCIEFQNTTGKLRLLKSGEYLGDLVKIQLKEFNGLIEKFSKINKKA